MYSLQKRELKLIERIAVPSTHQERTDHDYVHDVFAKCDEVLQQSQIGKTMVH